MKAAPAYQHFEKATDCRYMQAFFARHVQQLFSAPSQIEVFIPRISIRHETHFVIQYIIRDVADFRKADRERILCGYLPLSGAETNHHLDFAQTLADAATGLEVPRFPYDPQLPQLAQWIDPTRVAEQTDALLDQSPSVGTGHSAEVEDVEVLAYRLGRRCTLGISKGAGTDGMVAKIMRRRAFEQALAADLHLRSATSNSSGPLGDALPRLLGSSREAGVMLMERVPGRSLHDLWALDTSREACRVAGRLLASLHAMAPGPGSVRLPRTEWDALTTKLGQICTIFPDLHSVWQEAKVPLQNLMPAADRLDAQIHGDFYDKQILFTPERATMLDYDTMGRGDPALDVGNFLAHASLRKMQDPESAPLIEAGVVEFQRAYTESGARWPEAVRWWRAITLARLAGLYALRPRWRKLARPLMAAAVQSTETVHIDV